MHKKTLIGPFRIDAGVTMNSVYYTQFLKTNCSPYDDSLKFKERKSTIFMHDNAPSHASKYTADFLKASKIFGDRLRN